MPSISSLPLNIETLWLMVGLAGQALFSIRFLIQWIASEKEGRSVLPHMFWYFSIGGGVMLLLYAVYRRDPVFIIGQASGLIIYARNLHLIRRNAHQEQGAAKQGTMSGAA